jgi:hypothetical protein
VPIDKLISSAYNGISSIITETIVPKVKLIGLFQKINIKLKIILKIILK